MPNLDLILNRHQGQEIFAYDFLVIMTITKCFVGSVASCPIQILCKTYHQGIQVAKTELGKIGYFSILGGQNIPLYS
jgi:hypothetical protein